MDKRFRPNWPDGYPEILLSLFKVIDDNSLLVGIPLEGTFIVDYDAFREWFTKYHAVYTFKKSLDDQF